LIWFAQVRALFGRSSRLPFHADFDPILLKRPNERIAGKQAALDDVNDPWFFILGKVSGILGLRQQGLALSEQFRRPPESRVGRSVCSIHPSRL
jgi:hypothetical protein